MGYRAKYHPLAYFLNCSVTAVMGLLFTWVLFLGVVRLPFSRNLFDSLTIPILIGVPISAFFIAHKFISKFSFMKRFNRLFYKPPAFDKKNLIVAYPEKFDGKPFLQNTTITVEYILDLLSQGFPAEAIVKKIPGLTPEQIQACLDWKEP